MNTRTTQIEQAMKASQNAGKVHDWPEFMADCTDSDWAFYCKLQQQREHEDWTPSDLMDLSVLAGLYTELVENQKALRDEGSITYGGKMGLTPVKNPRVEVVATMTGNINAIARRLGLTSMSVEDKRARANRGKQARDATGAQGSIDDDRADAYLN